LEPVILSPNEIDFEEMSNILKEAFGETRKSKFQSQRQNFKLSQAELQRKYLTGLLGTKISVVIKDGKYVAINGLLKIGIQNKTDLIAGWMSCDTAVTPEYRGLGLSKKCINVLRDSIDENSVFLGYPNLESINIFKKMGWNIKNQYDILLKITNFLPIPKKFTVNKLEDFNTSIETRNIGINKNSQYLNWRYPKSDIFYQKFTGENNNDFFHLVITFISVKGVKALVILEIITKSDSGFLGALNYANKIAKQNFCFFLISSSNHSNKAMLKSAGFRNISTKLNPRPILLAGESTGPISDKIWDNEWDISIGDWDAI
jgi:hypothetical protein